MVKKPIYLKTELIFRLEDTINGFVREFYGVDFEVRDREKEMEKVIKKAIQSLRKEKIWKDFCK